MRTTLDVDDDVLLAVKERARRERRSIGAVLSELARESLSPVTPPSATSFLGFVPFPSNGQVVTNEIVTRIRDDEGV